ncbi:hypothetical protein ABZ815_35650 [Nonomuraea sp. NPDC047529]|uniref:hypothetical protein n=1 Tax=Nonomuraea sp. NPDC047529 TaxID=3155623 RepID=UPI0033E944F1
MTGPEEEPERVRLVRTADLADLRFRFPGLSFKRPAARRVLVRAVPDREGLIVVTFPAQHVVEQAFFESAGAGLPDPVPVQPHPAPPVVSRISGRSTLVFVVGPDDEIPYTAEGLLAAMGRLPLRTVGDEGPADPLRDPVGDPRTAIELPYRLLLSPPPDVRWTHRTSPADDTGRVELWHTRVSGTRARAVWTRDFPGDTPVEPPPDPLTTSLTPADRAALVHLTSDRGLFTEPGHRPYVPVPVEVGHLILSALGGWLDALGSWDPRPAITNVSQWRHRAAMGRDHYVRVLYSGYLCPFGHRADLVKVTERKFDPQRPEHPAYLAQRIFITCREPVRDFPPGTVRRDADGERLDALFPFRRVELLSLVTPDLSPPADILPVREGQHAFFPAVRDQDPYLFKVRATDLAGRETEFDTPLLFLTENFNQGADLVAAAAAYNALDPGPADPGTPPARLSAALRGARVAVAAPAAPDDTTVEAAGLVWGTALPTDRDDELYQHVPGFLPVLRWASAVVPAVSRLTGALGPRPVRYARRYRQAAFDRTPDRPGDPVNPGEVFLELVPGTGTSPLVMDFDDQRDRSGGLAAPTFTVAGLSRLTGPVSAARTPAAAADDPLGTVADGTFRPSDFFDAIGAKLFGVIPLSALVKAAGLDKELKAPRFVTQTVNAATAFLTDLRRVERQLIGVAARFPAVAAAAGRVGTTALTLVRTVEAFIAGTADLGQVDTAFRDFSAALGALGAGLPADVDHAVVALLGHLRQALAIWDDAPAGVLPLRRAIESAKAGLRLPESVAARLEWTPDIQPWSLREGDPPIFVPHDGHGDPAREGRFSVVVDLRAGLRPDVRPAADVTCTLEEFDLVLLPGVLEAMRLDFRRIRFTVRAGEKPDVEVAFRNVEFIGALSFVETLRRIIPLDGFSDPPTLDVSPRGVLARYGMPLPNLAIGVFSLENIALNAYLDLPFAGTRPLEIGFAFCRRDAPFRLTVSLFGGGGWFGIVLSPDGVRALDAGLEFGAAASVDFGVASGSVSVMAGIYFHLDAATGQAVLFGYFRARGEVDVLGLVSASIELYLELGYEGGDAVGRARITITIEIGFFEESVEISCEKRFGGARSLSAAAGLAEEAGAVVGAAAGSASTFAQMMAPYRDPVTGARRDPVAEYCGAFAEVG